MRIILIGPPGSGKGTQSHFIMKKYDIPIISVGNILRDMINEQSNSSNIIKNALHSGHLVPDELIINLVIEKIKNINHNQGFLLDGFPRTATQAYAMKIMNIIIDFVLVFSISVKSIISRISGRYIHIPSGRIYHPEFNSPKKAGYDDITGEMLVCRKDDTEEIIRNRLIEYYCYTEPVIYFYYRESRISNNIRYFSIDCDRSIQEIQYGLMKILN